MNLKSFNSKKYVLTFFMSTCLLTSSFLSTSAKAANFTQLANQTPALSGFSAAKRTNEWNKYSLVTKQAAWKKAKLVPDFNQAILDVQNGFDPKLLSHSNTNIRHKAREKNAEITLYIAQIEQPDYDSKFTKYVEQGEPPETQEVAAILGIDYDHKRLTDQTKDVRRFEKDKKVIIDRYIDLVKTAREEKDYITKGMVPELEELANTLNIDTAKAKHRRTIIRDQVMANKKAELITIGKIPTQEELNKLFGKDKEADDKKYTNDIRRHVMHDKKQEYINNNNPLPTNDEISKRFNIKKFEADHFLKQIESERTKGNNNQNTTKPSPKHSRTTTNTTGTSSEIPFETGRAKPETKSFDFRGSMHSLLNSKPEDKLSKTEQHLKHQIKLEEHTEEFKEILTKNPIDALQFAEQNNLDNSFKQEAISNIDLSKDMGRILFTVDDKGNRTILNTILTTTPEHKDELIKQAQHHAIQTLPTSISDKDVSDKKKLILATLAATEDKKILAAALDNWLSNNGYKRKPEVDSLISILLSDETTLKAGTNKIFELPVENNVNNNSNTYQNGIPVPPLNGPPPIPPLNGTPTFTSFNGSNSNHKFDFKNFEATYPRLYKSYNELIQNKASQNQVTTTSNNTPDTKANMGESLELLKQKAAKQNEVIGLIRNEVTKSYDFDPKILVSLFGAETKEVTEQIDQNQQVRQILTDHNITMTDTFKSRIFNESFEEAQQRLNLSQITDAEQNKAIKQYVEKQERKAALLRITNPIEQLMFANKYINILGQSTFNGKLNELIENPNKLISSQKINFVLQGYQELTREIPTAKSNLDKLKQNILKEIEIQQLITNKEISQKDLLNIIKDKHSELLKSLLEAKVISEENKLNNPANEVDLKGVIPSLDYLNPTQLTTLLNRVTIEGIKTALQDKWEQENKTASNNTKKPLIDNNGIPIPPPMPNGNSNFGANYYLIDMGYTQEFIDRMDKVKPKNNFGKKKNRNYKAEDFKSNVGKNYYTATSELRGTDILLTDSQKLDNAIKKEVLAKYIEAPNRDMQDDSLLKQAFEEKFYYVEDEHTKVIPKPSEVNFDTNFIGPRTEVGQEIYELYEQALLKLARDPVFIEYVKNNNDTQKDERELLISFIEQIESKCPELEQKYGSNVQPENSNKEKKTGRLDPKLQLFQQENESANDESSTKDDTHPKDSNKKSEKSDSETALPPRLLSSNNSENAESSDNKKSLLALRASDKEDEGYETDEAELEKSNNTAEEELKKDMLLENEDKAIDIPLETEEIAGQNEVTQRQQVSDEISKKAALLNATSTLHKHVHASILTNKLNVAAIGAGDEEASINRGVWISGLYGINKQGAWKNIPKYQGRTTGVTIGLDAEFINSHDVIGIAYSRLASQVKYNKKRGKTAVNGHLLSIYGLKELIKGFSLQAITSYGHHYIKNKTTSINNIIGKYQNNNVSFETLLNYKYRTKHDLHFIPSIGFKYDYSRASNYKEYNVDIENLMMQKKSNQSFESSLGGKIVFKHIATRSNIVLTPSLHGNIEHHFNNRNTKVNAKATCKGQALEETNIPPKQPKLGYNIGSNILMSRKNINVLFEYNYYTHRKYQSHQGLVKLKVNL